jgi:6,7-dimethyl-8-ribityllumazine synthase
MAEVANSKLYNTTEGIPKLKDALVILVKTEWNAPIVDELEKGCIAILQQHQVPFKTMIVPGAVEIPFAIQSCWNNQKSASAFIALACVIRGGTPHFDYVCQSVTLGISQLNISLPVPTIFGVLTVDNEQQAKDRIGGKNGHKGEEAALTAIKMITINEELKKNY